MKTTSRVKTSVPAGQRALLEEAVKAGKLPEGYLGMLRLIADMFDEIAAGVPFYMVIGATKARNAYSLTVLGAPGPGAMYADGLRELGDLAAEAL